MFDGTLDLTGSNPDDVGFPAVPSGSYEAHVAKAEWRKTDNPNGEKALPHETPYLALGIQINEDEEDRNGVRVRNAYVWKNLFAPPADYDPTKAQRMKNEFANFLVAIGEDYTKKGYQGPDAEALLGQDVTIVVRKRFDKYQDKDVNEIEGFKTAGSSTAADGLLV